jgi:tetratricopeptide (TPR) repeat protein
MSQKRRERIIFPPPGPLACSLTDSLPGHRLPRSDQAATFATMSDHQERYDDAMFDYTTGDYPTAVGKFHAILAEDPAHFDAQLALAMCFYRQGDYATAIVEGHKAEKLRPNEQLVHTNLSLFYMKSGDKQTAEKHGLQARIASWKENMAAPAARSGTPADSELQMAQPKLQPVKLPEKFPDQPWKKNKPPAPAKPAAS